MALKNCLMGKRPRCTCIVHGNFARTSQWSLAWRVVVCLEPPLEPVFESRSWLLLIDLRRRDPV
jgi:hypothetical protein